MSNAKRHALQLQLAALSSAISFEVHQGADGWVQALPDGEFASVDGRPADVPSKNVRTGLTCVPFKEIFLDKNRPALAGLFLS